MNELKWELVLTNVGKTPIRRMYALRRADAGGAWKGHHEECFAPDFWKSDRPSDEEFGKHGLLPLVTLKAGESVSLPASLGGYRGEKYTLSAAYQVGQTFAEWHKVWEGKVEAKPVVSRAVKPRKD